MQQVPSVVFVNGKPVHHGVVERAYDKLRAIIQLYVLHKQEDRRLLLPSVVSTEHQLHHIHMTACRASGFHRYA